MDGAVVIFNLMVATMVIKLDQYENLNTYDKYAF